MRGLIFSVNQTTRGVIKGANRSRARTDQGHALFISSVTEGSSEVKDEDPSESTDVWKCASAIKLIGLFTDSL